MNFQQNNPIFQQMFGGYPNFQQKLQSFVGHLQNEVSDLANFNPMQSVQQKIQSGEMTPQEFEMYRQQVNMMTGMNK